MEKLFAKIFISISISVLLGILVGKFNAKTIFFKESNGKLIETSDKWTEDKKLYSHENLGNSSGLDISKTIYKRNVEKSFFNYELAVIYSLLTLCVLNIFIMFPYLKVKVFN